MFAFESLREEQVDPTPKPVSRQALAPPEVWGAQGLASFRRSRTADVDSEAKTRIKNEAQAEQEDLQNKIQFLMKNHKLWHEFKSRLSASEQGKGKIGIRSVMKEFVHDHPEIGEMMKGKGLHTAAKQPGSFPSGLIDKLSEEQSNPRPRRRFSGEQVPRRRSLGYAFESPSAFAFRTGSMGFLRDSSMVKETPSAYALRTANALGNLLQKASNVVSSTLGDSDVVRLTEDPPHPSDAAPSPAKFSPTSPVRKATTYAMASLPEKESYQYVLNDNDGATDTR
jgi:hypothetical protein